MYKPSIGSETGAGLDFEPSSCTITFTSARNFSVIQGFLKLHEKRETGAARTFAARPPSRFKTTNILFDHVNEKENLPGIRFVH